MEIYTDLSSRDVRFAQQKDRTGIWPTDVSRICVTVRLPPDIPFRSTLCGSAEGCRGVRTAPGNIYEGRYLLLPSLTQKFLGDLKTIMMIILLGGWLSWPPPPVSGYAFIT